MTSVDMLRIGFSNHCERLHLFGLCVARLVGVCCLRSSWRCLMRQLAGSRLLVCRLAKVAWIRSALFVWALGDVSQLTLQVKDCNGSTWRCLQSLPSCVQDVFGLLCVLWALELLSTSQWFNKPHEHELWKYGTKLLLLPGNPVVMPGATSSFLLLVAMPFATN